MVGGVALTPEMTDMGPISELGECIDTCLLEPVSITFSCSTSIIITLLSDAVSHQSKVMRLRSFLKHLLGNGRV